MPKVIRFGVRKPQPPHENAIHFARCGGENWSERRALIETLYWRSVNQVRNDYYLGDFPTKYGDYGRNLRGE